MKQKEIYNNCSNLTSASVLNCIACFDISFIISVLNVFVNGYACHFRTTVLSKRHHSQQNYRPQHNCTFQKTLTAKSSSSEQLHFRKYTRSQIIVIHRSLNGITVVKFISGNPTDRF